ncbi:MAG: DUF5703 domain-containing protein [Planctomycetia bacterium]|nr:DUF5703 domain-containing protein [Planctomycetia bacterium]
MSRPVLAEDPLTRQNVVWDAPSKDSSGSMPIGNGDVGLNVWAEPNGDVVFLIAKTDAWSENARLLKLGRVRVRCSPNPLAAAGPFRQELRLRQGEIAMQLGEGPKAIAATLWVDANRPVVHLDAESPSAFEMEAKLEVWRTAPRELGKQEVDSAYGLHGGPNPIVVSADTVVDGRKDQVVWYHRNARSIWAANLKHQGLESFQAKGVDPLLGRTFGGCLLGEGLVSENATTLRSAGPRKRFSLHVYPLTAMAAEPNEWLARLEQNIQNTGAVAAEKAIAEHRAWWDDFWNRSWIRVSGTPEAEAITRGYTLQRWITACGGRGAYPIKFNGSIFTVDSPPLDPDYRRWGGPYWWQNTRLPYWPLLASGDFDLMKPMFRMYRESLPLAAERTRVWFGHGGAFLPETMYFWGMYVNENYGWQRDGLAVSELTNHYIRREYTASPELMAMMLDYFAFTEDESFLRETLLPTCDALLEFWDKHYQRDAEGRLVMYPGQALETYQDAANPTPDVAGLRWVLGRLLELPERHAGAERREFWTRLLAAIPPLPTGDENGEKIILPAGKIFGGPGNSENPELYAVFPFRLYGVGKPDLDVGRRTYAKRKFRGASGWRQDDTQAALLGLTDEAAGLVASRAASRDEGSRFPAFWGPNFDWIPDQDHGGNLMMALETMLLQADAGKILVLPAWPKSWDVAFKLHAPGRTTVEGVYRSGKFESLKVTPERPVEVCPP